jgi:hypothetical protein
MDQACEIRRGGNKLKQNERQPVGIMEERSLVRNCGGRQGQNMARHQSLSGAARVRQSRLTGFVPDRLKDNSDISGRTARAFQGN